MTTSPTQENPKVESPCPTPDEPGKVEPNGTICVDRVQIDSIICDSQTMPADEQDAFVQILQSQIAASGESTLGTERHANLPSDSELQTHSARVNASKTVTGPYEQLVVASRTGADQDVHGEDQEKSVSRSELVEILENFVELVRMADPTPAQLSFLPPSPPPPAARAEGFTINDKTEEVIELRCQLMKAQETIIRLLTDRVEDKSTIATLEAQMRLLPDLQSQADRAMTIAAHTDGFQTELHSVKQEIEKIKSAKLRTVTDGSTRTWWVKMAEWMLKQESTAAEKV